MALKEGAKVRGRILDVDKKTGVLDLSLRPEFVLSGEALGNTTLSSLLTVGTIVECQVELVKANYLILSTVIEEKEKAKKGKAKKGKTAAEPKSGAQPKRVLAYTPSKDYNTQHLDPFSTYSIGHKCTAKITSVPSGVEDRVIAQLWVSLFLFFVFFLNKKGK